MSLRRVLAVTCGVLFVLPLLGGVVPARAAAPPSPAFVQGTASTTATKLAYPRAVAAGDLLVAGITTSDGGVDPVTGVSDNLSGAWTRVSSVRYGNGHTELYSVAASANGSVTVTFAGPRAAYTIAEYSGAAGLDQVVGAASAGSPRAGPTAALAATNELVVGVGGMSSPGSFTAGTGFTLRTQAVAQFLFATGLEDGLASSTAGQTMTMGSTTSGYYGAVVAVFKAVSGTPPSVALTVHPSAGPAPLSVTADASASTGGTFPIASYTFAFGDGTPPAGPQPGALAQHVYTGGGTFTLTVTATDSSGASASRSAVVSVGAPTASVTLTPASGAVPLAVTADASKSSDPVSISSYTFNFGDGSAPVGPQPGATAQHSYTVAGSYTVTVTVTDSAGASASATATATAAVPPSAALLVTPSTGQAPLAVTADASNSTSGSRPIATYTFNFGDGSPTVGPQSGATAPHTYHVGGTFTVTVTVTDGGGVSGSATATVSVAGPQATPPTAAVTLVPSSGTAPVSVTADASGSTPGSNPIATYKFDFGDGSAPVGPQAAATAHHTYVAGGTYTTSVTVTDTAGLQSSAAATIVIAVPPAAALTVAPNSGFAPLTVSASGAGSSGGTYPIATYTFDFGDGTVVGPQPGATAGHTYTTGGSETLVLTVTDTHGNTSSASAAVQVNTTTVVQDTFQRPDQTGWGTASNGTGWGPSKSGLSVVADEGLISSSNPPASQFETLGSATAADGDGLVRFTLGASTDAAGIILRAQSNGGMALGRYDGSGHLQFMYRLGTSWTVAGQVAFAPVPGVAHWLRFKEQGQNVFLKSWVASSQEPSAWNWSGTSSALIAPGLMGLYGFAVVSSPVEFDTFSVNAPASQTFNSAITGSVSDSVTGAPIGGVLVSTIPVTSTAMTSSAGTYSLQLQAGTYTVLLTGAGAGYNANYVSNLQAPVNGSVAVPNQPLLAIPSQLGMDTFTRPNQTNGLGTASDGHVWASDLGVYPGAQAGVTANQAWVDTLATATTDFDTWMGYQYQNQEISIDLNMNSVLVDPNFLHGARLLVRVQNSTTWLLMTLDPTAQTLRLWATLNNSWTLLGSVSHPLATNTWYHAKLDAIGTLLRGKVWPTGTAEPGWQISANQSIVNGAGQVGLRTTGSYTQYASPVQTPITQIAGTVTSAASGAPIAGATVTAGPGISTVTDSRGTYTLGGLTGGTGYTVSASASGFQASSAVVTPATATTSTANFALS